MEIASCFLTLVLIFGISAMPNAKDDVETILDTSTSSHPSVQMGIMIDKNGDEILTEDITVNDDSDKSDDPSETSELLGFNLSLFPTSPIFGANVMFQKLQESLRLIRDQLNTLWSLNDESGKPFDIPDDYVNSTSYSKFVNGTLVTVNETIFKKKEEDGIQSYYHTKVISVHPENETMDTNVEKQNLLQHRTVNNDQSPIPT